MAEHQALDERLHALEFLKVMDLWLPLRLAECTRLQVQVRIEPKGLAATILKGLETHGRGAARLVASQTGSSDSSDVLWWVNGQLSDDFSRDEETARAFHRIRHIVDNALLQTEDRKASEAGMRDDATHEYLLKVETLKELLVARANGREADEKEYSALRRELVAIPEIRNALPEFVRRCSTIREFWNFIKPMFETDKYRRRTDYLQEQFMPILESLEGGQPLPDQSRPRSPAVAAENPRPDLLLVTVNEHETQAIHDAFLVATGAEGVPVTLEGRLYHNLGTVNETTVYHAISEMGSGGSGGMQQTVEKAISALDPGAVIAVGIAFGVNEEKQAIGDILVSKLLRLYDLQRVGKRTRIVLRGARPDASPRLMSHFRGFTQTKWKGAKVRIGVLLTGDKLVDNVDYRDQLIKFETEAEGGEMEGAGLYVSSYDNKVDWIVIKAICDWADGNKEVDKTARQKLAAKNAAEFVVESLRYTPLQHPGTANRRRP